MSYLKSAAERAGDVRPDTEQQLDDLEQALRKVRQTYEWVRTVEQGERREVLDRYCEQLHSILAQDLDSLQQLLADLDTLPKLQNEQIAGLVEKYDLKS